MKHLILITKIVAGLVVLAAVMVVSHLLSERWSGANEISTSTESPSVAKVERVKPLVVEGEDITALAEKIRAAGEGSHYELGERAFGSACVLLAGGDYDEAEVKLKELVARFPSAPSVPEARRILGQRNIDRFLGDQFSGGKIFYKVKSGDSYFKIARDNETSLENLMLLNGLFNLNKLHRGEELLIMPLHFNLVVDIPHKRLTLEYGKEFVKDYPFLKLVAPQGRGSRKTRIAAVESQLSKGRTLKATSEKFRQARKVIVIKSPMMEIVGDDYPVDDAFQGVILRREQVEELSAILRRGNLVEIRY